MDRDIIEDFKENYLKSFETNKTPVLRADPPVIVEELDDCTNPFLNENNKLLEDEKNPFLDHYLNQSNNPFDCDEKDLNNQIIPNGEIVIYLF